MQTKRILVVGGGSSGWTAAAHLNAALNDGDRKFADIGLIESPDIPRIGVGEATIPNIRGTLAAIGIDETDFLKAVDGTFKQSIRFVDWLDGPQPGQWRRRAVPAAANRAGTDRSPRAAWIFPSPLQPLQFGGGRRRPALADERPLGALHQYGFRAAGAVRNGTCAENA